MPVNRGLRPVQRLVVLDPICAVRARAVAAVEVHPVEDRLLGFGHEVRSHENDWMSASPRSGDRPSTSIRSSFFSNLTCRSPTSSYVRAARSFRISDHHARAGIWNGGWRLVSG